MGTAVTLPEGIVAVLLQAFFLLKIYYFGVRAPSFIFVSEYTKNSERNS